MSDDLPLPLLEVTSDDLPLPLLEVTSGMGPRALRLRQHDVHRERDADQQVAA
jgi:hypothetical protein